tara:strand:+ start:70 stop:270 length:201 start_codon:yes stop_codon:yes gene_type:complete
MAINNMEFPQNDLMIAHARLMGTLIPYNDALMANLKADLGTTDFTSISDYAALFVETTGRVYDYPS